MNVNEMKAAHPMPWRYLVAGNQVQLIDARGVELPMFLMLDFVGFITTTIAKQDAENAASHAV